MLWQTAELPALIFLSICCFCPKSHLTLMWSLLISYKTLLDIHCFFLWTAELPAIILVFWLGFLLFCPKSHWFPSILFPFKNIMENYLFSGTAKLPALIFFVYFTWFCWFCPQFFEPYNSNIFKQNRYLK